MGKRPLVRRRGRGGMQFRAAVTGKLKPAKYPSFDLDDSHEGEIIDLVHETGRDAPLSKVRFEDGSISFIPAILGTKVGSKIKLTVNREDNKTLQIEIVRAVIQLKAVRSTGGEEASGEREFDVSKADLDRTWVKRPDTYGSGTVIPAIKMQKKKIGPIICAIVAPKV